MSTQGRRDRGLALIKAVLVTIAALAAGGCVSEHAATEMTDGRPAALRYGSRPPWSLCDR